MGIKHFFMWFQRQFASRLVAFQKTNPPVDEIKIDTFMIDLNGVFHNSAAKIYQYGDYEKPKSLLGRKTFHSIPIMQNYMLMEKCYQDICESIDTLLKMVRPKEKLVLCIDGVAPQSKQNQQRQRRYRGSAEHDQSDKDHFDSCCITPGTKFMDDLSRYIDWYIRKKISEDPTWASLEIIFSDEKVPGEGEHKLINYIRKFGRDDETFCINAMDADLVMLSLATHKQNFYLLRDTPYNKDVDFLYLNIGLVRKDLVEMLRWKDDMDERRTVHDFVLICFLCGNDFLPHIPSINLIEKGLETIINLYIITCKETGQYLVDDDIKFNKANLKLFLKLLADSEKGLMIERILKKNEYIPEPLVDKYTTIKEVDKTVDFDFLSYKKEFYQAKGMLENIEPISHCFLQGCQWVLTYYLKGISDWTWLFPYDSSPFAGDLAEMVETFEFSKEKVSEPLLPFQQLLCVLPPKSSYLLPEPLSSLFKKGSPLSKYYPEKFHINYEGKKRKWEGVVELPAVNVEDVKKAYTPLSKKLREMDAKRNRVGKSFSYKFSVDFVSSFKSKFGDIAHCTVSADEVNF